MSSFNAKIIIWVIFPIPWIPLHVNLPSYSANSSFNGIRSILAYEPNFFVSIISLNSTEPVSFVLVLSFFDVFLNGLSFFDISLHAVRLFSYVNLLDAFCLDASCLDAWVLPYWMMPALLLPAWMLQPWMFSSWMPLACMLPAWMMPA